MYTRRTVYAFISKQDISVFWCDIANHLFALKNWPKMPKKKVAKKLSADLN